MTDKVNSSLSLHQLLTEVDESIKSAMPGTYWVRAEILHVRHSGYWALELSSYEDANKAKATAMIWQSQSRIVENFEKASGTRLAKGLKILVLLDVGFHSEYGLRLNVREFDPAFSLGDMEARINAIRQHLESLGELNQNRALTEPRDFTRVAVVSPQAAAGLGDFRTQADALQENGLCVFEYYPALFQGERNEATIIDALKKIVDRHKQAPFDAIAIIRGGGDKAGLYELNKIKIARGVCRIPIPVFVGVGHERDSTILDELANRAFATPSLVIAHMMSAVIDNSRAATKNYLRLQKQGTLLLDSARNDCRSNNERQLRFAFEMVAAARDSVFRANRSIRTTPLDLLQTIRRRIDANHNALQRNAEGAVFELRSRVVAEHAVLMQTSSSNLATARDQIVRHTSALSRAGREAVIQERNSVSNLQQSTFVHTRTALQQARYSVKQWGDTIELLNPSNVLKRGFALVFSAQGNVITSKSQLQSGEKIEIRLRDGSVAAKTDKTGARKENGK